jgi:hypothetical protein
VSASAQAGGAEIIAPVELELWEFPWAVPWPEFQLWVAALRLSVQLLAVLLWLRLSLEGLL